LDIGSSIKPVQGFYGTSVGYFLDDRRISSGTGTPEAQRISEVGSLYLRTDGGYGTTLYGKLTGSGDTGWEPFIHNGAPLSVGDTTFVDVQRASQTNAVSGALTFAHATNGVHGLDFTHVRYFFVGSGGPHTLTIPSGWRTNVYSAVPPALTNGTISVMYLKCGGPTASAAAQTNCYVSFEYYK
jgi:hypothetical protein